MLHSSTVTRPISDREEIERRAPAVAAAVRVHATAPILWSLVWRSVTQARYVLIGALALLAGLQLIIVGQAVSIESTQSFGRISELLPAFLTKGLGSKALLLATFKGSVAFGYFHPVVLLLSSLLAAYITTEAAHEVESRLVDLELARSVPRHLILTRSLVVSTVTVVTAAILMAGGTELGLRLWSSPAFVPPSGAVRAQMLVHLVAVAVCFGAFGLALGATARRWSTAFTTVAFTAIVLYLIDFLAIGWPLMRSFTWISPFHFYPALSIIAGDAPPFRNLAVLTSATLVMSAVAYWQFGKRDL